MTTWSTSCWRTNRKGKKDKERAVSNCFQFHTISSRQEAAAENVLWAGAGRARQLFAGSGVLGTRLAGCPVSWPLSKAALGQGSRLCPPHPPCSQRIREASCPHFQGHETSHLRPLVMVSALGGGATCCFRREPDSKHGRLFVPRAIPVAYSLFSQLFKHVNGPRSSQATWTQATGWICPADAARGQGSPPPPHCGF